VVDGIKALRAAGSNAQIVTLSNNASAVYQKPGRQRAWRHRHPGVSQLHRLCLVKEASDMARAKNIKEVSPAMLEGFASAKFWWKPCAAPMASPAASAFSPPWKGCANSTSRTGSQLRADDHTGLDFADLSIISSDGKFRR